MDIRGAAFEKKKMVAFDNSEDIDPKNLNLSEGLNMYNVNRTVKIRKKREMWKQMINSKFDCCS